MPPGQVSVDIVATSVEDLGSYSITVNWEDTVLQFDSITNGTLLGSSGLTVICSPPVGTSSSVTFDCSTVGLLPGASGDGLLAKIDFSSVSEGKSPVAFGPVILLSTTAVTLDVATTDGDIFVEAPGPHVATFFCDDNAPETSGSGDNDGFEINPDDACEDDGQFAQDAATGTNNVSSCSDPGKDRHVFSDFEIEDVSSGDTIDGIEVGLDAKGDVNSYLCAELSWNNGTTWTPAKFSFSLSASETTYWLGSPADTWGHVWTAGALSNGNLLVRVTSVANIPNADIQLDAVAVRVSYTH